MENVQKLDCLYNKYSKAFKDKERKMNCWRNLGKNLTWSPQKQRRSLKNIRMAYGQYLKRRINVLSDSGSGNLPVPPEFGNLEWRATEFY